MTINKKQARKIEEGPVRGGFDYWVSDDHIQAFARLTLLERLQWLDEARRFTLLAQTPTTAHRRERLRRGETL